MSQPLLLSTTGFADSTIAGSPNTGALLLSGTNDVWSGPITVASGSTARIDAVGTTDTISGAIGGDATTALQFGDGTTTDTFVLTGANTWSGSTTIQNKTTVNIGANNASGALSPNTTGVNLAGTTAFLDYDLTTTSTWSQLFTGTGVLRVRFGGTLDLDGTVNPAASFSSVVVGNGTLSLSGAESLKVSGVTDVGDNLNTGIIANAGTVTGVLIVPTGTTLLSNTLDAGNTSATTAVAIGTVNQTGGTVTLASTGTLTDNAGLRLGQTANGTGNYSLSSGVFSIGSTGSTAILGIAEDGNGNFVQTGGTASAFEIDVNTRNTGTGTGTFTLNGGLFTVGSTGTLASVGGIIADGGSASASIGGGGTLQFTATATTSGIISTPLTLTGAAILDTQNFSVTVASTPSAGPVLLRRSAPGTCRSSAPARIRAARRPPAAKSSPTTTARSEPAASP